jgi:hypothetical protein
MQAAEVLSDDLTAENVARLLAARPNKPIDVDRLRTLQQPEPVTLWGVALFAAHTVGKVYQLCPRTAYRFLDFSAHDMLRRALRGFFRREVPQ